MKVTVSDAPNSQKELNVELPVEKYNEYFEAEFKKIAKNADLPGFRKGKAPKDVVLKKYEHQIRVTALEKLVNDSVNTAISENNIRPLNSPEVKEVKFDEGEPITFKVLVEVFPEIEVANYKDFEVTKEVNKVLKKDVDSIIDNLRDKNSVFEPVEDRAVQDGDLVTIDFEGKLNGEIISSACAKGYELAIGSNSFIPGFESSLIGYTKGQTGDIVVTFPESYHEKSLAGQPVTFTITLHEIKAKSLPELDDEFAKSLDEKYATLKDLTDEIKADLQEEAESIAQNKAFDALLDCIIDANKFDVPAGIVRDQAGRMVDSQLQQYRMYGMDPAQFGLDKNKLIETTLPAAEKNVKSALVINKIADENKIDVSDEEVEEAIKEQAERFGLDAEAHKKELEQYGGMMAFKNRLFTDKVYEYLESVNKVTRKVLTAKEMDEVAGE